MDISIAWKNLRYEANHLITGKKIILNRSNGLLKYHSLNGFLGPSGAGKTTLLNCLNGQLRTGLSSDTEIYINKNEKERPSIRFVEQHVHETIIGEMTVRQILNYAFRFKNKNSERMVEHINCVLKELILPETILDNRFENCSGGEQKRIAIAQELMSLDKPTFLFVDEPTTGLDSNAALLIMKCLLSLAKNHRITILISLHTPNSEIMSLLDHVYILAKGGACIYSGPPDYMRENFHQIGYEFDDDKLPIEEYIKLACKGTDDELVKKFADRTIKEQRKTLDSTTVLSNLRFLSNGIKQSRRCFSFNQFILQFYRFIYLFFILRYKKILSQMLISSIAISIVATTYPRNMVTSRNCYPKNPFSSNSTSTYTCQERFEAESLEYYYRVYQAVSMIINSFVTILASAGLMKHFIKVFGNEHRNRKWTCQTLN